MGMDPNKDVGIKKKLVLKSVVIEFHFDNEGVMFASSAGSRQEGASKLARRLSPVGKGGEISFLKKKQHPNGPSLKESISEHVRGRSFSTHAHKGCSRASFWAGACWPCSCPGYDCHQGTHVASL